MSEKTPEFWGSGDDERLSCTDEDEAIEAMLDEMTAPLPEKITVYGYAPMEVNTGALNPLEHVLEYLDEEYGDSEGDPSKETDAMKEAERVFLEVVKKEYVVWACESVCKKEIIVADWIKENRPDWLTENK
jgi:hypothetical protein